MFFSGRCENIMVIGHTTYKNQMILVKPENVNEYAITDIMRILLSTLVCTWPRCSMPGSMRA